VSAQQIALIVLTLVALVVTVLAYPNKYGALTGRSRLFRTVGICLLDLLLMLVTLETFIDFRAGVSPRVAPIRAIFYLASIMFLCFSILCITALDSLESFSAIRRERRTELERTLQIEIDKARAEQERRQNAAKGDDDQPGV
jgi:hypothetical protein